MTTTDSLRIKHSDRTADVESHMDVSMLRSALTGSAAAGAVRRHTRASTVERPECRSTRAAMHDYLNRRLRTNRRHRFEDHLYVCAPCIRAFIDIREVSWAHRAGRSDHDPKAGTDHLDPHIYG